MSQGKNVVNLLGHLAADSILRFTQTEVPVLSFRVATGERYQVKGGEWKERAQFHPCVLWGKRGQSLSEILKTGFRVDVVGKLEHRSYEDKQGIQRYISEVRVSDILLLSNSAGRQVRGEEVPPPPSDDDGGFGE